MMKYGLKVGWDISYDLAGEGIEGRGRNGVILHLGQYGITILDKTNHSYPFTVFYPWVRIYGIVASSWKVDNAV